MCHGFDYELPHIMDESRKAFEEIMATSGVRKYVLRMRRQEEKDLLSKICLSEATICTS